LVPQFGRSIYKGVFTDKISLNIWEILNKIEKLYFTAYKNKIIY